MATISYQIHTCAYLHKQFHFLKHYTITQAFKDVILCQLSKVTMLHGCLLPPSCTFMQCNIPDALTLHQHYCKHLKFPHHANVTS